MRPSESFAKSQEEGSRTSIVIYSILCPHRAKLDTKAIGGPVACASEELCRVALHVLGASKVSAMLGKCIHLRLSILHSDGDAQLSGNLHGYKIQNNSEEKAKTTPWLRQTNNDAS